MSHSNPTPLKVGMTGKMFGATYHVAGRVVMGTDDGGTTYYWQEFNLQTAAGDEATLVYEQTEIGNEWKWFKRFEPKNQLTVADAESKRVGDSVLVDSQNVRVTRRDVSQVYFIEGKAPEGVFVGEVAKYFNAGSGGGGMIVASWIGDEIEFFRGMNLSTSMVRMAFNLPIFAMRDFTLSGRTPHESQNVAPQIVMVVVVAMFMMIFATRAVPTKRIPAVIKTPAVASPLRVGSTAALSGKNWRIIGHDLVKISEVGFQFDRHEYQLQDDDTNAALLVFGMKPKTKDWMLFTPLQPVEPMTPAHAGTVRLGDSVNVDGIVVNADELFLSAARRASDSPAPGDDFNQLMARNGVVSADSLAGETNFCFSGKTGRNFLLVRWNKSAINFYKGTPVKDVEAMKFN